jgi:hypothetical protein
VIQRPRPPIELVHSREQDEEPPEPGPPRYIEKGILPFFDSGLWAVLFAIMIHVSTFLAMVILKLLRTQSLPAAGSLVFMLVITTMPIRDEFAWRKRFGSVTALMLTTWAVALALAWVADAYGVY